MTWPDASSLLAPLGPWFESARRDLPWRDPFLDRLHPDPYAVLVSEVMLQQTQVATVIPYFTRWMNRFPDVYHLASASDDAIHLEWQGLGYYRRARFLQKAAQRIAALGWPKTMEELRDLPGLGPYTAAAMASIAFQMPEPALDGNAFRVLARLLLLKENPQQHRANLEAWLRPSLAIHGPSRLTQGIMELGATLCTPSSPKCHACPLQGHCAAHAKGLQASIPPPKQRPRPQAFALWLLAVRAEDSWLVHPPGKGRGLLAGLWKWPSLSTDTKLLTQGEKSDLVRCAVENAKVDEWPTPMPSAWVVADATTFPGWTQVYTHRREQVTPLCIDLHQTFSPPEGSLWVEEARLEGLPMGRRDQRLRTLLYDHAARRPQEAPPAAELLAAWIRAMHPSR